LLVYYESLSLFDWRAILDLATSLCRFITKWSVSNGHNDAQAEPHFEQCQDLFLWHRQKYTSKQDLS
jgi:hypothetical protein